MISFIVEKTSNYLQTGMAWYMDDIFFNWIYSFMSKHNPKSISFFLCCIVLLLICLNFSPSFCLMLPISKLHLVIKFNQKKKENPFFLFLIRSKNIYVIACFIMFFFYAFSLLLFVASFVHRNLLNLLHIYMLLWILRWFKF